jgi:glycosyltransferase involved in cell wall biosynthesis
MHIAYICHWSPYVEDGVGKKIKAQAAAWRKAGVEVRLFWLSGELRGEERRAPTPHTEVFLYRNRYLGRVKATVALTRAVDRWRPDVAYLRYTPLALPPIGLMRRIPTVIEVNSDDRAEYRDRSLPEDVFNRLSRRLLLGEAAGFAFVTEELVESVPFHGPSVRHIVVPNAINLSDGDPLPPARNARPRLVFLGAGADWHGVDKILWLAAALPEFDFDLVGAIGVPRSTAPSNVKFHGFCSRSAYEAILRRADVGIGPLALHRKGMAQAAPLKVREYLLRGMPVVIAHCDPAIADDPWFVLKLPNTAENVVQHVHDVRRFVSRVADTRIPRREVAARIDIERAEAARLAFLSEVSGAFRERAVRRLV